MKRNIGRSLFKYINLYWGLMLICALVPVLFSGCQRESRIPKDMVAEWVTQNLRYQGCYLLISTEWLMIGATDATMLDYYVEQVKTSKRDQQLKVVVKALDIEQTESTFSFIYESGALYFENQPNVIWKRNPYVSPF